MGVIPNGVIKLDDRTKIILLLSTSICVFSTGKYIVDKTNYWFERNEKKYGIKAFCNWDVTAGSYLTSPENFTDDKACYKLNEEDLKTGFLRKSDETDYNAVLNLPQISNEKGFVEEVYRGLEGADIRF